jgi:predicted unusual protein kinase regulating ubiquinone biosynthesis (AarF/ABC1/UbiB family)
LQYSGRILANGLIQLGALYIKLGQIISSREKLLPAEWITAMECLQDQVPAKSGQQALDLAYSAWPQGADDFRRTFRDFDTTPVAAASLGQVHKAVINTGENEGDVVAIKLQRPFLREIYDQDLTLLTKVAAAVDKFGGSSGNVGGVSQSWTDIFKDAEDILYREIDYRDEAANGIRFCNDFGLTKGGKANKTTAFSRDGKRLPSAASWLRAPYVYNDFSSEKVLVMEFVPSIKINNNVKLAAANVTQGQREYLADCLGRAYLRQFCCNGFFSTDPHSGTYCTVLASFRVMLVG